MSLKWSCTESPFLPFYVAFSTDFPENYYSELDIKIPFLNGGLFDPIKNYDWINTKVTISNKLIQDILDNLKYQLVQKMNHFQ